MLTELSRQLLLQQGRLVLALILAHVGLFLVAWLVLRRVKTLPGAASIIYALLLATSVTPVFGIAVLQPLLGDTSTGTFGLVALAINLVVLLPNKGRQSMLIETLGPGVQLRAGPSASRLQTSTRLGRSGHTRP